MTELTILIPCLNEEDSVAFCINEAKRFISKSAIKAEILVSDNGSTDKSVYIAESMGVRVVHAHDRGYGNALRQGIACAQGKYIIMGDCDGSYDFENLEPFINSLRAGSNLVIGNRFAGGIEKGAMPFIHRYIGVPILSFLGRIRYGVNVRDFHCGLRGFERKCTESLNLHAGGMEFATEIIAAFARHNFKISQVPTPLRRTKRRGKGHLRTVRDGMRHLIFLFSQ